MVGSSQYNILDRAMNSWLMPRSANPFSMRGAYGA